MALKDYVIPRTTINLGNGASVAVRGLCTEDATFLYQVHRDDVEQVIALFSQKTKGAKDTGEIASAAQAHAPEFLNVLMQHFPLLAANAIALAADEPESFDVVRQLPLPVQVEALVAIARLTFGSVDDFKKFVGNVMAVMQSVAKQQPPKPTKATKSTGSTA